MYCHLCIKAKIPSTPKFCDYSYCNYENCNRWEETDNWDDLMCCSCAEDKNVCQRCGKDLKDE